MMILLTMMMMLIMIMIIIIIYDYNMNFQEYCTMRIISGQFLKNRIVFQQKITFSTFSTIYLEIL